MRAGQLDLLTGWYALPRPVEPAGATQASLCTPLPEGPSLLIVGDDASGIRAFCLALRLYSDLVVAPGGLEAAAAERWDEQAPWSLRLAREARAAGWRVPAELIARRVEHERPRTWGEAFVTIHAAHAWLRFKRRYAIAAPGGAGRILAKRLPEAPLVVIGAFGGDRRRALLAYRRGEILLAPRRLRRDLRVLLRGLRKA